MAIRFFLLLLTFVGSSIVFGLCSLVPTETYAAGLTPSITSAGLGCTTDQCMWISGAGFSTNCDVNLFKPDWSAPALLATLHGSQLNCTNGLVTFQIPSWIQNAYPSVNVNVTNSSGIWSQPTNVSIAIPIPQITFSTLACDQGQCVQFTGQNFTSQCVVSLFSADWATYLGQVAASCTGNAGSFTVPSSLRSQYGAVNFNVTNQYGKWSSPVLLSISPGPSFNNFFEYSGRRASLYSGNNEVAIIPYAGRYPQGYLRFIGPGSTWGTGYFEVAEFVAPPTGAFFYQSGWYPGGASPTYMPGGPTGDLTKAFASIHATLASITTPQGTFDIMPMLDPSMGELYALSTVPSYAYTLTFEGNLINNDTGALIYHYRHVQTWYPPAAASANPGFPSPPPNLRTILQLEDWDDPTHHSRQSGASYAEGLGCFWQSFGPGAVSTGYMQAAWGF